MANVLDANGLTLMTRAELLTYFTEQFQLIYGADVNLASDTPDGQWINIMIQAIIDLQDLLLQIYNSFDPDNAVGNVLDQRVAINGIQRQAGTYTVTPITIVTSQSVNLYGLDQDEQPVYTVSDAQGTLWVLQETQLGLGPGTDIANFQAADPGATLTIPNTITVQVTIVLGVTSVNNPTTYTTLGINEETDAQLKIRRELSVSLASQGYLQGLLAALENVDGVSSAYVFENDTNVTDSDGIPGHSIWVIVAGSGAAVDIAQAIYTKRNAGCGMFGDETYAVPQVDGSTFNVYWDNVVSLNLFIAFVASSIDGTVEPDVGTIRSGLVESFVPGVYEEVNINGLATEVQIIDPNCLVTGAGFSMGTTQILNFSGIAAAGTFKINYAGLLTGSLNWNDTAGTIQTAIRLLSGLSSVVVTGSIAGQALTFDLTDVGSVDALLFLADNTLVTSGPVAIVVTNDPDYQNTLWPTTKQNQFIVSEANIYITPMTMSPSTYQIAPAESVQFQAYGGYGAYVYSISQNNSGASIDASTGEYTAGAVEAVTDQIKAVDVYGNIVYSTVTVI